MRYLYIVLERCDGTSVGGFRKMAEFRSWWSSEVGEVEESEVAVSGGGKKVVWKKKKKQKGRGGGEQLSLGSH